MLFRSRLLGMTKRLLGMTKRLLGMTKRLLGMTKRLLGMTGQPGNKTRISIMIFDIYLIILG